jgi:hypothetical protein
VRFTIDILEGDKPSATMTVEAESWLLAFQSVRTVKNATMASLVVDVQIDEVRVLDPSTRQRYQIKTLPQPTTLQKVVPRPARANAPLPSGRELTPAPARTSEPKQELAAALPTQPQKISEIKAKSDPPISDAIPFELTRAASIKPAAMLAATLLSRRDQDPSAASPLTYREFAFAVPIGTEETDAEAFARRMLADAEREIPSGRGPKFVNIAIFDEIFTGKATIAPLVVLEWKDWKGSAVVRFPRRGSGPGTEGPARGSASSISVAPANNDMFLGPATSPPKGTPSHE